MLVEGGVLNQPVIWLARNYAGVVYEAIKKGKRAKTPAKELNEDESRIYLRYLKVEKEVFDQPLDKEELDDANW